MSAGADMGEVPDPAAVADGVPIGNEWRLNIEGCVAADQDIAGEDRLKMHRLPQRTRFYIFLFKGKLDILTRRF